MKEKIINLSNILNENIKGMLIENKKYKLELEETRKRLFNALVKLDRIKLITNDIRIKEILEEE